MKIGVAQINSTVGDFHGNAKRIINAYREALDKGAECVITPECSLVGYPPRDLLYKSRFVEQSKAVLEELAKEVGEIPLLVGYVDRGAYKKASFTNTVAILCHGKVEGRRDKTLFPDYDVFDESRYFTNKEKPLVWSYGGRLIGITICEDVWGEGRVETPILELIEQGADLILNLSASPFHQGKSRERLELLKGVVGKFQVPVVYCNAVGGQDELIFDGGSMLLTRTDQVVCLPQFKEVCLVVDSELGSGDWIQADPMWELHSALTLGLRDYVRKCGFSRVCLGLSGGIDSALTAALAVDAIGAKQVRGLTMPSPYSSQGSVDDSMHLAESLGIRCDRVDISETYLSTKSAMQASFEGVKDDVTEENMQARIRGLYLMSLSNNTGALLLTTGNKSELSVGYCTMYGDMCGGLGVISDLPKTLVYKLSEWMNREQERIPWSTIRKAPSAELRLGQVDQDTLPEYAVLDDILQRYVEQDHSAEEILSATQYEESMVRWVQRRVDLNEWKRKQAAFGLKVTSRAFGRGRRMPLAHRYLG